MVTVAGQIAHPVARANPYRIGHDGVPRVLPGTGGIAVNRRIGDRCIGLAGDHTEPGVALHNNGREVVGPRDGPNTALITYACVGNRALVVSGPCRGKAGWVTGKHGGINHVLVDFPTRVLVRLQIGDRIQIYSHGLGLSLLDFPEITALNCSPRLLASWGLGREGRRLVVPVTHRVPAAVMGSGLGKSSAWRGDYDIQMTDPDIRRRYGLDSLRFGDMVAIVDADNAHGPHYRRGRVTVGIIVHGDSTVSGHGPGLCPLLTGPAAALTPVRTQGANLAELLGIRTASAPRAHLRLTEAGPRYFRSIASTMPIGLR